MITTPEIVFLVVIAALGHAMALFWYLAGRNKWKICQRTIYDLPIESKQIKRELRNSLHAPIHAVLLAAFLYLGFFRNTSAASFIGSALATMIWAEIWHYASHRAFHLKALHWIHLEHHRSHLSTAPSRRSPSRSPRSSSSISVCSFRWPAPTGFSA